MRIMRIPIFLILFFMFSCSHHTVMEYHLKPQAEIEYIGGWADTYTEVFMFKLTNTGGVEITSFKIRFALWVKLLEFSPNWVIFEWFNFEEKLERPISPEETFELQEWRIRSSLNFWEADKIVPEIMELNVPIESNREDL